MATYLPVLLFSVNANSIPDDNVLTTMPRGQVDYLSHDWQEEDVWRSWRNMTRQKNEITNGLRLENASWRTWWKQRNNLKTVSPETLNWLKDSDVTWLYGPLHTAVDWSPPPKPEPVPDSVESRDPASTHDRLDLHSHSATSAVLRHPHPYPTKPILKHRTISEILTSELPVSPIFSPQESEEESHQQQHVHAADPHSPPRPQLPHMKSDTHITRFGPSRAFRKDSPPRVKPPSRSETTPPRQPPRASGAVRCSLSQDSTSSTSGSGCSERTSKKKHISFNTFVEQCIAIDKHPRNGPRMREGFGFGDFVEHDEDTYDDGVEGKLRSRWDDDDGYEEDREDNFIDEDDRLWLGTQDNARSKRRHFNESAVQSDSDSDDGVIEIRPSTYRHSTLVTARKRKVSSRSKSSSSSIKATILASSGAVRQRRKSASAATSILPSMSDLPSTSAYRPRPVHPLPSDRDRVTIAPIAPTLLKTTGAWEEGFGDEGGVSDDGIWDFDAPGRGASGRSSGGEGGSNKGYHDEDQEQNSEGTPVELVYVPPFGSIYGYGAATYWKNRGVPAEVEDEEDDEDDETDGVEVVKLESEASKVVLTQPIERSALSSSPLSLPIDIFASSSPGQSVPVVVIDSSIDSEPTSVQIDQVASHSSFPSTATMPVPVPSLSRHRLPEEERRGRGRSLSISPVTGANSTTPSSSSNAGVLPARGRSQSWQDLQSFYTSAPPTQGGERRGRSSTRGPSSSFDPSSSSLRGSYSSRGSHSAGCGSLSPNISSSRSPISGSLSPDGTEPRLGGIGSVYAGGRIGGRERERIEKVSSSSSLSSRATSVSGVEERRGRYRGRREIGSNSGSNAASPSGERGRTGRGGFERTSPSPQDVIYIEPALASSPRAHKVELDSSVCSVTSECSTATVVPSSHMLSSNSSAGEMAGGTGLLFEKQAMEEVETRRKNVPTPSNSPIISMTMPTAIRNNLPSKIKAKSPPPIVPPPTPSLPSTSTSNAPGEVSPSVAYGMTGRRSLERASSRSQERSSSAGRQGITPARLRGEIMPGTEHERTLAEARRGRHNFSRGEVVSNVNELISPTPDGQREKETIIDRAVGLVSSAGAYLKLWPNQSGAPELQS